MPATLTHEQIRETVLEIIQEISPLKDDITLETNLEDLGFDSLEMVELESCVEEQLGIEIPDDYLDYTSTIENITSHERNYPIEDIQLSEKWLTLFQKV